MCFNLKCFLFGRNYTSLMTGDNMTTNEVRLLIYIPF